MASVYFGARVPLYAMNGNWTDVTQWYLTMETYNGKYSPNTPGEPLGRLPTNADYIELLQSVTANFPSNWLGDVRGTSNVSPFPTIYGGTWNIIAGYGLIIKGGTFTGIVNVGNLTIDGNATFNTPVSSGAQLYITANFTNTISIGTASYILSIYGGTITSDISTSVTGVKYISVGGNAIFTNPAPWIFGKQTVPIKDAMLIISGNLTINRDITIYSTPNLYGFTAQDFLGTITGNIVILPCAGYTYTKSRFQGVNTGTYAPPTTVTIPVTTSGNDTLLPMATYPKDYGFKAAANFSPTVRLSGLPVETDVLGVLI